MTTKGTRIAVLVVIELIVTSIGHVREYYVHSLLFLRCPDCTDICDSDSLEDLVDASGMNVVRRKQHGSNVWQHFEKIKPHETQCKICQQKIKIKYSNTSSLGRHLKYTHSNVINLVTCTEAEASNNQQQNITYLDKNSKRSREFTKAIASMMALDLQPYSLVEGCGFRKLMKIAEPLYKIPSRTTFSREIIPKLYEKIKQTLKDKISIDLKEAANHKLIIAQKSINEQQEPLKLIQDIDTRWNSTYEIFKRFILLQTTLNIVLCEDNMPDNLDSVEWNFIIAITDVLKPINTGLPTWVIPG
ncbi:zinc finger BED domain-containing protein 4 [Frieseomelitta varia]|uniref:zinc finger BED domain-containing protein 4 n=1 Tax=Frieseomelitta varia TaxID=561572 RepID=UPI001CB68AE8|nr:zinc finger BED domain-containing protein 4 [Frieseomelitta varia]